MTTSASELPAEDALSDEATSVWLKRSLREALERDPVDALNDALLLAGILEDRLRSILGLDDPD
jgi:hypothetical protein